MDNRIMVFTKNLIAGKVKTRIGKVVGNEKALAVYKVLLSKTLKAVGMINGNVEAVCYFSEYIEELTEFEGDHFRSEVQEGNGLGERMENAISKEFALGAKKICLVGGDIYGISAEILMEGFNALEENEIVIGPANDGGYYLIGMKDRHPGVFKSMDWGTSLVFEKTIKKVEKLKLSYHLLQPLPDIDKFDDIPEEIKKITDL